MKSLLELEAEFVGGYAVTGPERRVSFRHLPGVDGAQGVIFICPKCGSHSVLCWFANPRNAQRVPAEAFPRPGRWTFTGNTIATLTLLPSVDLSLVDEENPARDSRCYWHGFVENGQAR